MKRAVIVGGSGYTGAELIRLLYAHEAVELVGVTSRKLAGQPVSAVFPPLHGLTELEFISPDEALALRPDVVFFATPHGVCMQQAGAFLENGAKVIDLSADFRIRDAETFYKWYQIPHTAPELLAESVYGISEIYPEQIAKARLIANPGCYPTAVQLSLYPLLRAGILQDSRVIIDAKSGVSGAGREAKVGSLFAEVAGNFKAYAANGHRHLPEIVQQLSDYAKQSIQATFVPHLVPMSRGIETTCYLTTGVSLETAHAQLCEYYQNAPFVEVLPLGAHPETRFASYTNRCVIGVFQQYKGQLIVSAVIDNLLKGASGQAIQNMNLLFDLPNTMGLSLYPLIP